MAGQLDTLHASAGRGPGARRLLLGLAIAAGLLLPVAAGAGWPFGRAKARPAPAGPTVAFAHGVLRAAGGGLWEIDGRPVQFGVASRVEMSGKLTDTAVLRDGMEVTVLGPSLAGVIAVRQCNVEDARRQPLRLDDEAGVEWSAEDPTVGWGTRPQ